MNISLFILALAYPANAVCLYFLLLTIWRSRNDTEEVEKAASCYLFWLFFIACWILSALIISIHTA